MAGSAAISSGFFALWYLVLHPGYWINDDLKAIWVLAGYPLGMKPIPFLIHSNVLLGFALDPLYALSTPLNWAMIFFAIVNAAAIWALLYVLLDANSSKGYKWLGTAVILGSLAAPAINLTFTYTSALAGVAGLTLLLSIPHAQGQRWLPRAAAACLLILTSSLIRLEMLGLVFVLALPIVVLMIREPGRGRRLAVGALCLLAVGGSYGFDRLYLRMHPDWNYFYAYDGLRAQLHDAHRLSNLHGVIRRIGWTPNDQELFAHWFFPDPEIYSYEHVRLLVDRTPGYSQNLAATAAQFFQSLHVSHLGPSVAFLVALGFWAILGPRGLRRMAVLLAAPVVALMLNFYLSWAYKDPDYVLLSTVGAAVALSTLAPALGRDPKAPALGPRRGSSPVRAVIPLIAAFAAVSVGVFSSASQALVTSSVNAKRAAAYESILGDLSQLQREARIAADALIISPAHGLPYEWSYPFRLTRPSVSYLDTGWITFSPFYEQVLRTYGIRSLPEALYMNRRLYLMVDAAFTPLLAKYYIEKADRAISFVPIYLMPNEPGLEGYNGIFLYQLSSSP